MAIDPTTKLKQTVLKIARYMSMEWDMSVFEVIGALESAKLDIWNEVESDTPPGIDTLDDSDDDDDEGDEL